MVRFPIAARGFESFQVDMEMLQLFLVVEAVFVDALLKAVDLLGDGSFDFFLCGS